MILEAKNLRISFHLTEGQIRAVQGIDLAIKENTFFGFMGESGCGKSVTAKAIMGIIPRPPGEVSGEIVYHRQGGSTHTDLVKLDPKGDEYRDIRGKEIGMIFQEPISALSPVHRVGDQIGEVLRVHRRLDKGEAREQTIEMLARVGIAEPSRRVDQYPFELSGGMCQRVMIAMALCCRPKQLIADEPTTGLDVTIQAQILELMKEIQDTYDMSVLFITHDLGVIAEMVNEVATMYMGQIVELGSARDVFYRHYHPYTEGLLKSVPIVTSRKYSLVPIAGNVPNPFLNLSGCKFRRRCHKVIGKICEEEPPLFETDQGHLVKCWLYEKG